MQSVRSSCSGAPGLSAQTSSHPGMPLAPSSFCGQVRLYGAVRSPPLHFVASPPAPPGARCTHCPNQEPGPRTKDPDSPTMSTFAPLRRQPPRRPLLRRLPPLTRLLSRPEKAKPGGAALAGNVSSGFAFVDENFVCHHNLPVKALKKPQPLKVIDGRPTASGGIASRT